MTSFITKKKLITLLLIVVFLAIVNQLIGFFIKTPQISISPTTLPTPTPAFAPLPKDLTNATIITTPDQTENISVLTAISATFPRSFKEQEKSSVLISLSPAVPGTITWSDNNTTISFSHEQALITDTQYTITLTYFTKHLTWSFKTISQDNLSQAEKDQIQLQADANFGQWQNSLYQNYPWYDLLPIQSNAYFVYFDINTKRFIATLYTSPSDSQIGELKKDILTQFQTLGIPSNKYTIVWKYDPNPGSE